MTLWAAWHPENGFGPVEEISVRKTKREADQDAGIYNYSGGNNDWRPVQIKIVLVHKPRQQAAYNGANDMWRWGGG